MLAKLNRYWGTKPKRLAGYIRERAPHLGNLVAEYYTWGMPVSTALAIVNHVLAPAGGRLKLWETEKVNDPGGDQP